MMTLPTKKGEIAVVWSDHEPGSEGPVRVVVESDGRVRWSMRTECGLEPESPAATDYDWDTSGAAFHHVPDDHGARSQGALTRIMIDMLMALRGKWLLKPDQKAKPSIRERGENVVSKTKGNKLLIVTEHGDHCEGGSLMSIATNKPLDAGEWVAALDALAHAIDDYMSWWEGEQ